MGREITQARKLMAARLYFMGLPYDDIAAKSGIAKGSVAIITEELRGGRFPQFEHVADLVNGMRELAVQLRKAGMAPTEATLLFGLTKRFLELGVEPSSLEAWIRMCQSVGEEELPSSQIIRASTKLAKLEQEGVSYEEAIERLNSASAELRSLQNKVAGLRAEEAQLEQRKQSLSQACLGLESQKKRLEGEEKEAGRRVDELLKHSRRLAEEVDQRQKAVSDLNNRENELNKRLPLLEEKVQALHKEASDRTEALKNLDGIGFARNDLERLWASLEEMAQRHGKPELAARFLEYVASYDSLLGLETAREALAKEVDTLVKQRDALTQFSERLKLPLDEVAEGIAALKALMRKGVLPSAVVSYHRVLASAGTDAQSLEKLVGEFGGMEQTLAARRRELEKQVWELEAKRQALEVLKGEEARVKESIATLREVAVREIKNTAGSAAAEVEKLCQGLHQDITRWGDLRAEMGKCQEELRLARYFAVLPLSEKALSSLVEDVGAAVVLQYLVIALIWCRKKFNPKLGPPQMITRKYYRISQYTEVELADIIVWALLTFMEGVSSDKGRA